MLPSFAHRRTVRLATLLLVGLAILGLAPSLPSSAQTLGTGEIQYLDNSQGEFADGAFERTSISPERFADLAEDEQGAVQLAPAGALNPWGLAAEGMPREISNYGLVELGTYSDPEAPAFLFAVGGELGSALEAERSDKVYRAQINRATGTPDQNSNPVWKEFTMPTEEAVLVGEDFCAGAERTAAARSRNSAASVALPTGNTLGYIYVVGGIVDTNCTPDITTPLVQIATVNASGDITGWQRAPYLPSINSGGAVDPTTPSPGVADAMVTIVRTSTNERFLYVMGGISLNPTDDISPNRISRSVLYAKINPANGSLVNPEDGSTTQPWAAGEPIAFVENRNGLRDGAITAARVTRVNENSNPPVVETVDAILLAGGCHDITTCNQRHPYLLKAEISNPSTGEITWDTTPSTDNSPVSFPARSGLGLVFNGGKLYLIGGTTSGLSTGGTLTVPAAFLNEDLDATKLAGSNDYFVGLSESDPVLPGRRSEVAVAVMPALPPPGAGEDDQLGAAWVFVGGGYSDAATTPRTNTLYAGKVGGEDEATATSRATDGWYYSSIEGVSIENRLARVLSVRWSALIDRSANSQADIKVQFRKTITGDRLCREQDFDSNDPDDAWRAVDADPGSAFFSKSNTAVDPFNVIELATAFPDETFEATCLQFRAQLLQNGSVAPVNATGTPRLLSFSLEKIEVGAPDLQVGELAASATQAGAVNNVTVRIQNLNNGDINQTLGVADATGDPNGSFFVHICVVSAPLSSPTFPELTLPAPGSGGNKPACADAYYEVYNVQMPAGQSLLLPAEGWRNPNPPYNPIDLRDLLDAPGKYRFGVVIDYEQLIDESEAGELNNRGERTTAPNGLTATITINVPRQRGIYLPMLGR